MRRQLRASGLAGIYVASVLAANWLTEHVGMVPIGPGLSVTAGTFAAGVTLLARNLGQPVIGRARIVALMLLGCGLSWYLAAPWLAVASASAFAISELADMAVYSKMRARGWSRAVLLAALVGGIADTLVFLHFAGRVIPVTASLVIGQVVVKVGVSAIAVGVRGALLRQSLHRAGA